MSKPYGFWNKNDPVEYFRKHCSHIKSIGELRNEDHGLMVALWRTGKLEELFPEKRKLKERRDWSKTDPVEYFWEYYPHIKSRIKLAKEDGGLYNKLRAEGLLDKLFPEKRKQRDYRQIDPVKLFRQDYSHVKSREQLRKEDEGLYCKLLKEGLLDELLPKKQEKRDWNKIDPVELFQRKYSHIKNRYQLQKEDNRLYYKLRKEGLLDELLPKKQEKRDYGKTDPLELFKRTCSHVKSRTQLAREHNGLYKKLWREKLLDKVFPEKQYKRDWSKEDPVEYLQKNYPHIRTRKQLIEEDVVLYNYLLKIGKLDEVLPSQDQLKKRALETAIERYVG